MLLLLFANVALAAASSSPRFAAPHFPAAFSADVRITTHILTDDMRTSPGAEGDGGDGGEKSRYPPIERLLRLRFDRARGMARIDEGDVVHVRRFDLKKELRIDQGPYPSCKRSYLSEPLPEHQFPRGGRWANTAAAPCPAPHARRSCRVWRQEEGAGQVALVYVEHDSYMPLQVVVADEEEDGEKGLAPLLTFTWENIALGPPDALLFADVSAEREDCDRQAGGFPWVHVFHSFFKI